ncbi:MAG: HAMP domain-containing histidine kinase [Clostridia bacterium]|nr:HAMP domain-containing histidine kinase [Clostridia bacterium]
MLRRLRIKIAVLNVAVSGAILLIMAFVALGVTEGMIAGQYERDLQQNAATMLGAMQSAKADTNIQFASQYSVFIREGNEARLISGSDGDHTAVAGAVAKVQSQVDARVGRLETDDPALHDNMLVQRYFIASAGRNHLYRFQQQVTYHFPNLLVESGTKAYRVSATTMAGEPAQQVFVLQDRMAELAAVASLRWLFAGCVAGGLALTGLASLYLSTRSIRPVEQSIQQQRAFVAAASHELRTPVAAIRANAEVLGDAPLDDFMPYLNAITREGERMSHLVSDLMDLARTDAGELQVREEDIDVAEIASRAASLLKPLAEQRRHKFELELESAICRGDSDRLCQVLVILLDNAIRYTPEAGAILISTGKEGQQVYLRVADNGPGIPDTQKKQVFERFYRVDKARSTSGSGLGLSVAVQLTEQMHGTIKLTDAPGGGSVFHIFLRCGRQV